MPKIKIDKKSLEGPAKIPIGVYTVRLDGFDPSYSKDKRSANMNPIMKIINNPALHDRRIFDNVNTNAGWIQRDFCHAFGVPLEQGANGDFDFPGEFKNDPQDPDNPEKWKYEGKLLGQTGQLEVAEVTGLNGKTYMNVKRYLCRIPGCKEKHSENLLG